MDYRERCYGNFVSKHWKYYHSLSDAEFKFIGKVYRKKYKAFLPDDREAKILDVACGAGHFLSFLKKEGYKNISGIDLSKEQLEIAKRMGIEDIEEVNLFEHLPKHPAEYEMVIANDIIEHLTKDEVLKFLGTLYMALQPGGRVLIGTLNASSLFGAATVYVDFTHEQGFTPISLAQVLRVWLWKITKQFLKSYLTIEAGTGRGFWKQTAILEPRMVAIGRKPSFKKSL